MGKGKQTLIAVRERLPRLLIACAALVFAFGLGMYVQSQQAAEDAEDDLYRACVNMEAHLSSPEIRLRLPYFQALESPMEDPGTKAEMAHIRRWAARIFEAELAYSLEAADVPVTHTYLYALSEELLGSSCPDIPSADLLFSACAPLQNAVEASASPEEFFPALETELNTPAGQETLALLGISVNEPITTQGGT